MQSINYQPNQGGIPIKIDYVQCRSNNGRQLGRRRKPLFKSQDYNRETQAINRARIVHKYYRDNIRAVATVSRSSRPQFISWFSAERRCTLIKTPIVLLPRQHCWAAAAAGRADQ